MKDRIVLKAVVKLITARGVKCILSPHNNVLVSGQCGLTINNDGIARHCSFEKNLGEPDFIDCVAKILKYCGGLTRLNPCDRCLWRVKRHLEN